MQYYCRINHDLIAIKALNFVNRLAVLVSETKSNSSTTHWPSAYNISNAISFTDKLNTKNNYFKAS